MIMKKREIKHTCCSVAWAAAFVRSWVNVKVDELLVGLGLAWLLVFLTLWLALDLALLALALLALLVRCWILEDVVVRVGDTVDCACTIVTLTNVLDHCGVGAASTEVTSETFLHAATLVCAIGPFWPLGECTYLAWYICAFHTASLALANRNKRIVKFCSDIKFLKNIYNNKLPFLAFVLEHLSWQNDMFAVFAHTLVTCHTSLVVIFDHTLRAWATWLACIGLSAFVCALEWWACQIASVTTIVKHLSILANLTL
jgi:hypothetical protein